MLAFTLARRDFREADQQITFYTKEIGKISAVARGIKRIVSKNAPALEPFSLLEVEIVPGKNYSHLTKAQVVESFLSIRNDLTKMMAAGFALDLIKKTVKDGERDLNIFKLIYSFEMFLGNSKSVNILHISAFTARLACFLGFTPIFTSCIYCRKKLTKADFFSISGGGTVCEVCAKDKNITTIKFKHSSLKLFRSILIDDWKKINAKNLNSKEIEEVVGLVAGHAGYHFGFEIMFPKIKSS